LVTAAEWDSYIAGLSGANILQTWTWSRIKADYGWEPLPQLWRDQNAAAMLLRRPVRLGGFSAKLSILYVPRGPLLDWSNPARRTAVFDQLESLARRSGAIFLKIDPPVAVGTGIPGAADASEDPTGAAVTQDLLRRGWRFSEEQIQFRNTAVLDLRSDEEAWLAAMKQKARYNLRLAQRKGVTVRRGTAADLDLLYRMYAETSIRDGFVIRPSAYYSAVWGRFLQQGLALPLIAEVDSEPVAGLILFVFAGQAWYMYGMSREAHRDKMPNYLLQWEAMRAARAAGAQSYDLWGAPDEFNETDPLWGVFRFKEGLGARVVRTLGAWDFPSRPTLYNLYTRLLPRLLNVMRRRGKERTRREVSA
jgi:lipid II:glycine glycyltransferase (peptidoglycan interpeptide bridge formation enzyme)